MADIFMFKSNIDNTAPGEAFNDMYAVDGNLAIVEDLDCIKQLVAQAIWLWYGDYIFNTTIGVTWRRLFGARQLSKNIVKYQLTKAIESINLYIPSKFINKWGIRKVYINSYNVIRTRKELTVDITIILNSTKKVRIVL